MYLYSSCYSSRTEKFKYLSCYSHGYRHIKETEVITIQENLETRERDERTMPERLGEMNVALIVGQIQTDEMFDNIKQRVENGLNAVGGRVIFVMDDGRAAGMLVKVSTDSIKEFARSVQSDLDEIKARLIWTMASTKPLRLFRGERGIMVEDAPPRMDR